MATRGELVSTHMPKKSRVENWLHECQLLASITLPLGAMYVMLCLRGVTIVLGYHERRHVCMNNVGRHEQFRLQINAD